MTVRGLAAAIQKLYKDDDVSERFRRYSYREAKKYSIREIRKKWVHMLKETGAGDIDRITG